MSIQQNSSNTFTTEFCELPNHRIFGIFRVAEMYFFLQKGLKFKQRGNNYPITFCATIVPMCISCHYFQCPQDLQLGKLTFSPSIQYNTCSIIKACHQGRKFLAIINLIFMYYSQCVWCLCSRPRTLGFCGHSRTITIACGIWGSLRHL